MKILLVDDSSTTRAILRNVIKISGLSIERFWEASQGVEALQILDQQPMDLLLVDLNMPIMDGKELIQKVRSRSEFDPVPILVVSSEIDQQGMQPDLARKIGVLRKPFIPEQIRILVQTMLQVKPPAS